MLKAVNDARIKNTNNQDIQKEIDNVVKGMIDFDLAIAEPAIMKKLGILFIVFVLALISCNENSISQRDKREAKTRTKTQKELVETQTQPQTTIVYYEPAPLSNDGNSYWFVVVEEKDGTQKINTMVKQDHKWFSEKELKTTFKKDIFILNIVQISKETYENN
jgi:hypothetical protein